MSASALDALDAHLGPWTEEQFLAQPHHRRVELLDGSLLVSPSAGLRHQWLSSHLWAALDAAAPTGVRAFEAVNLRVAPGRILIPDVTVVASPDLAAQTVAAADARLVVEITSPGNAFVDRVLKPQLYAAAGVPHYLRVELDGAEPTAHVFALDGDVYVETACVAPGVVTRLDAPFPVAVDLAALATS